MGNLLTAYGRIMGRKREPTQKILTWQGPQGATSMESRAEAPGFGLDVEGTEPGTLGGFEEGVSVRTM